MKAILDILKNSGYWILMGILFFILISFTEKRQGDRICKAPAINVDHQYLNHFIDEMDVKDLMTEDRRKVIEGLSQKAIDLKKYEDLILNHQFIDRAQVFRTLDGGLKVKVVQRKPLVRIFENGKSGYIDRKGNVLPLSDKFTARALVVTSKIKLDTLPGILSVDFLKTKEGQKYLKLFRFIEEDTFWKRQVVEAQIMENGKIDLLMQVGNQRVSLGYPDNIENKFIKLKVFLKKILPVKGWNAYDKVNLEYDRQIVCE